MGQMSIFDLDCQKPYKIKKPMRLIELFGGIGSQAKALENLNVNFEHYRLCEFDKCAVQSYNAVHGTNFKTSDITKIKAADLAIVDTDKYEYIMTYSFPCQDLSIAGKQSGMAKGSGTRSGLLWEVERLLRECKELPQVLLMENVPQVLNCDFGGWVDFLDSLGYKNYYKKLNAKNFGIPQNRERCFMVSVLGNYYYDFPKEIPLKLRLKDMLETEVDEKYYLSDKALNGLKNTTFECSKLENRTEKNGVIPTLCARDYKDPKLVLVAQLDGFESSNRIYDANGLCPTINTMGGGNREPKVLETKLVGGVGDINFGKQYRQGNRIYDSEAIACTLNASPVGNAGGESYLYKVAEPIMLTPKRTEYGKAIRKDYEAGLHKESRHNFTQLEPKQEHTSNTITTVQKDNLVIEPMIWQQPHGFNKGAERSERQGLKVVENYRIRKLTPKECWRLMGFTDSDFDKAKASGVSNSQLYKQAGNSIVVQVLEAIFRNLF